MAEAMTEMLAASKIPCPSCIISTGAPWRRPTSAARASPNKGSSSPPRRTDVCRQLVVIVALPHRSEGAEVGEPARTQPRVSATLVNPTKREAPIAVYAVPAQRGGIELLATHGLHRIAVNRFNLSNLDRHFVRARRRPR